ncbi:MAG: 1 protein [Patescibacteria group bacterium]|jgi:hypothetical protein|nr:1 protein [Patescibacteria group bacterium]
MAYLRNPLAWYKRYVEEVFDTPSSPAGVVGRAAHMALQHYYELNLKPEQREVAIVFGLQYLKNVADFEINFGKAKSKRAQKEKRVSMEREYLQAINFYLAKPPRHKVLGVEVKGTVRVQGLALPIKAVSDLVVESRVERGALDIIDHKFVDSFSPLKSGKSLFILQALFNYYTVTTLFDKPVRRFVVYECKKSRNADGSPQLRRYVINYAQCADDFRVFHRLLKDATQEITRTRVFLPNPSDMFEGENSFDIYRLGLLE